MLLGVRLLGESSAGKAPDPVAVEASPNEASATSQAMIGEEARDGQLVFVVVDLTCNARQLPTDAGGTQASGKLCTLRFSVRNASSSPAMLLGRFQYLMDAQSRTYGADEVLTRAVAENANRDLSEMNINPDVVVPMALVFDLPDGVEPTEARFRGTGRSRFGVNVRLQRP